jgi:hypothetical protein
VQCAKHDQQGRTHLARLNRARPASPHSLAAASISSQLCDSSSSSRATTVFGFRRGTCMCPTAGLGQKKSGKSLFQTVVVVQSAQGCISMLCAPCLCLDASMSANLSAWLSSAPLQRYVQMPPVVACIEVCFQSSNLHMLHNACKLLELMPNKTIMSLVACTQTIIPLLHPRNIHTKVT